MALHERLTIARGRPPSRPSTKPGAAKPAKKQRPFHTPDHDHEARLLANANKQVAYYLKENEQLKKQVSRAEAMGEHLNAIDASVKAHQEALANAQKKGRELLMRQKEQV